MAGARRPTAMGPGAPGAGADKIETPDPRPMDGESTTVDQDPPGGLRVHEEKTVSAKGPSGQPGSEKIGPSDSNVSCTETRVAEDSGQVLLDTGSSIGIDDPPTRDPADSPTRDEEGGRLADGTGETVGNGQRTAKKKDSGPASVAPSAAAPSGLVASQAAPRRGAGPSLPEHGDGGAPSPPDARAVLTVVSGSDRGRKFEIARDAVKIGRGVDNDIILTDIAVSRQHLSIDFDGSRYFVSDLGSGNGTIVNDRDEEGRAQLQDGDRLELGNTVIRFERPAQVGLSSAIATKEEVPQSRQPAQEPAISRREMPQLPQPRPAQQNAPLPASIPPVQQQGPAGLSDDDFDEDAATIAGRRPPDPPPGMAPIAELGLPDSNPAPSPPQYAGPAAPLAPAPQAPDGPPSGPGSVGETPSIIRALGAPPIAPSPASAPFYPTAPKGFGGAAAARQQVPQGRLFAPPVPDPDRKKLAIAIVAVFSVVVLIGVVAAFFATGSDKTALAKNKPEEMAKSKDAREAGGEGDGEGSGLEGFFSVAGGAEGTKEREDPGAEEGEERGRKNEAKDEAKSDAESMVERINRARAREREEDGQDEREPAGEENAEAAAEENEDDRGGRLLALVAGKRELSPSTWGNEESFLTEFPSKDELESRLEEKKGDEEEKSQEKSEPKREERGSRGERRSREGEPQRSERRAGSRGTDVSAARRKAQELYSQRQFGEAASVLRRAAGEVRGGQARRLKSIARGYDRLGNLLNRANRASRSDAAAAWSGYRRALAADRDVGGAHAGFIRTRLRFSAKKAAMKLMASGRYEQAKRAADDAPSSEVGFIYRSLEQKALGMYRKAGQLARQGQTAQAKDLLRRIKDMTKKGSPAWKKALKKLAQM